MHALILAGGFATRLWPLTEKVAKPLIPLAGRPLVSYLVDKIPKDMPITISTNQVFAADFEEWKKNFPDRKIEIFIEDSKGETEKKGALAATALFITETNLQEDLFLLAGDNYFGFDFKDFFAACQENPLLAAYDIGSKAAAKPFGVVVPHPEKNFLIEKFEEKPENPSSTLVSTGAYLFPKKFLCDIEIYSRDHADDLGGIFEYFMQKGDKVNYFSFAEKWYDVGSFPAFLAANKDLLDGGKIMHSSLQKDTNTLIGKNCYLEKNIILENVELENSIILEGTHLKNISLKNCVVGKNCYLENMDYHTKIIRDETVVIVEA